MGPVYSQESLEEEVGGSEPEKEASSDGRDMWTQAKECRQQWKLETARKKILP